MEAFGLAAGVLQVAGFGAEVGSTLLRCAKKLHNASKELESIAGQVETTALSLKRVDALLKDPATKALHTPKLYEDTNTVSQGCHEVFRELDKSVKAYETKSASGKMRFLSKTKWLFDSDRLAELGQVLRRYNDVLHLMVSVMTIVEGRRAATKDELQALEADIRVLALSNMDLSNTNKTLAETIATISRAPNSPLLSPGLPAAPSAQSLQIPTVQQSIMSNTFAPVLLDNVSVQTTPSDPTSDHLQRCMDSVQELAKTIACAMNKWHGHGLLGCSDIHGSYAKLFANLEQLPADVECTRCTRRTYKSAHHNSSSRVSSLTTCICDLNPEPAKRQRTSGKPNKVVITGPGVPFGHNSDIAMSSGRSSCDPCYVIDNHCQTPSLHLADLDTSHLDSADAHNPAMSGLHLQPVTVLNAESDPETLPPCGSQGTSQRRGRLESELHLRTEDIEGSSVQIDNRPSSPPKHRPDYYIQPASSKTRIRRGSVDRGGASQERPVSMIEPYRADPGRSTREIGPPPSQRGWDKINDLGRSRSTRDPAPHSPSRGGRDRDESRGRYTDSRDPYYIAPRKSSADRSRTPVVHQDRSAEHYEEPDYEDDGELILEGSTADTKQNGSHLSAMSLAISGAFGKRGSGPINLRSPASSHGVNSPQEESLKPQGKQEGKDIDFGGGSSHAGEQYEFEFEFGDDDGDDDDDGREEGNDDTAEKTRPVQPLQQRCERPFELVKDTGYAAAKDKDKGKFYIADKDDFDLNFNWQEITLEQYYPEEQQVQQQQQQQQTQQKHSSVTSITDFTPVASPSTTPYHLHPDFTVPGDFFSPLTSPALHAQNASQAHHQFVPQVQHYYTCPSIAASSAAPRPVNSSGDVEMGGNDSGYNMAPPVDYPRTQVNADQLRRLQSRTQSRATTRANTPPVVDKKDEPAQRNAFSALVALGGDDAESKNLATTATASPSAAKSDEAQYSGSTTQTKELPRRKPTTPRTFAMKKGMQIPIQKPQKRQMRQKGKSTAVEEEEKFEAMGNEAEPTKKARELSSTELLRKGGRTERLKAVAERTLADEEVLPDASAVQALLNRWLDSSASTMLLKDDEPVA